MKEKMFSISSKNIEILYEDRDIAVILKPAGISVHPGAESKKIMKTKEKKSVLTLVDFLKKTFSSLSLKAGSDRPGIVHRLDKDTSGLLLIAKTDEEYDFLIEQMKKGALEKYYKVLVYGRLEPKTGTIEAPVGRSFFDRKKMTAFDHSGKPSVTHYTVDQYFEIHGFGNFTLLNARLETGRTHQIRVHFQAIGFPVVGDPTYGKTSVNKKFEQDYGLQRQFLHAYKLSFPVLNSSNLDSSKKITLEAALPEDLQSVLNGLLKNDLR